MTDAYGNQLPIIHPGDPNFSDPPGTHIRISDLPAGFTAQDVIAAGGLVNPGHNKIPSPGEVFVQEVNGRPVLVVESSNPGNTISPTAVNAGMPDGGQWSHLNKINPSEEIKGGIQEFKDTIGGIVGGGELGDALVHLIPGVSQIDALSGQLGQLLSLIHI